MRKIDKLESEMSVNVAKYVRIRWLLYTCHGLDSAVKDKSAMRDLTSLLKCMQHRHAVQNKATSPGPQINITFN